MKAHSKEATGPEPSHLVPSGPYGGGQWTAHPIGLVIVIGLLIMGFVAMPQTRWLLVGSAVGGTLFGFLLWLRHR